MTKKRVETKDDEATIDYFTAICCRLDLIENDALELIHYKTWSIRVNQSWERDDFDV